MARTDQCLQRPKLPWAHQLLLLLYQRLREACKPLTDLTQKDKVFTWGTAEAEAFAALQTRFTTAPILAYPDNDCQF